MRVTPIKTHKIKIGEDIFRILDKYVIVRRRSNEAIPTVSRKSSGIASPPLSGVHNDVGGSILVITSKIISLCQRRVVKIGAVDKDELIKQESQYYLPRNLSRYNVSFTIAGNMLVPTSGIDESNGDGYYILWPKNPQKVANEIREYVTKNIHLEGVHTATFQESVQSKGKFSSDDGSVSFPRMVVERPACRQAGSEELLPGGRGSKFGVIISDSRTMPLRWGVTASAIAYSGFNPLKDYVGKPDLFGRPFVFEKLNIADALAAAAGVVMGEGAEQTPMALIRDITQVEYQDRNPTDNELKALKISIEDDLYAPLLASVKWKKGEK